MCPVLCLYCGQNLLTMKSLSSLFRAAGLFLVAILAGSCVKTISVTGVSLNQQSLTLTEGEQATLVATVSPADASDATVSWSSSNPTVASVSGGTVRALVPGTATITVTTNDGGKTATCAVTVNRKAVPVESVSLNPTSVELMPGESATLVATVSPAGADNTSVSWSSDDVSVATVENGKVTGVADGSATITVTTVDGGKTATCAVTVKSGTVQFVKMSYERLADMITPRADFVFIPTGDGEILAAGGHTTGFSISSQAEYYKDGEWHELPDMKAPHDMPFSAVLPDGRVLIGGGCSYGSGSGQSNRVDAYDPATHTFDSFASLSTARTLCHALSFNGKVLVSGNWYGGDGIELWSEEGNAFSNLKGVYDSRYNPYIFQTSADNAMVFGAYSNYGSAISEIHIDRLDGDTFTSDLFETWKPLSVGSNWRSADCAIGDYRHLILVNKKEAATNRGCAVALVDGESISLLPSNCEIPESCDFGAVYFAGPVVVDRSKKVGYAFGGNNSQDNVVCYILKIDYADALAGGRAKLTMYYTDPIDGFRGIASQGGITLLPDGRLMVAGGIYDSNYRPFNCAYAFQPF